MFRGRGKRTRPPNGDSPTSTLLQNPQSSNTTTSTNANSPSSMRPMNTTSPISVRSVSSDLSNSASSRRSVRIPKSLGNIRVQQPPSKKSRVSKAVASRKRSKLNDTAGETSGNSSNSAMSNRPKTKKVRIASVTRKSAVRQNAQSAARTAADLAAAKQQKINQNYATLINQRNTLPPGYKVKFLNQLLLNTAKKGDKAVKLIRARMREAVTEGLDRSKNLRNLAKKLSPNGQKKFTNDITNNLSVSRYMVIKNAISREIKSEAKEKAAKEKAAKEKAEANKVLNSAIQQRRANAKKAANEKAKAAKEKAKAAKEKAIANAKEVIRARQQKEANAKKAAENAKKAKEKENAKKVLNSAIQQRRANNAKKAAENAKKAKEKAAENAKKAENTIIQSRFNAGKLSKVGTTLTRNSILNTINSIIINNNQSKVQRGGAKRILRFFYGGDMSNARVKDLAKAKNVQELRDLIQKQHQNLVKRTLAFPDQGMNLSGKNGLIGDDLIEFMFLVWCDMLHDETINAKQGTGEMSFATFLQGDTIDLAFNKTFNFTYTPFMKDLVDVANEGKRKPIFLVRYGTNKTATDIIKNATGTYEDKWKRYMLNKEVDKGSHIDVIRKEQLKGKNILKPANKKMYLAIDQEGNTRKEFSNIIEKSYDEKTNMYKISGALSFANIMDPGADMVMDGKLLNNARSRVWDSKLAMFSNIYNPILLKCKIGTFIFGYEEEVVNNKLTGKYIFNLRGTKIVPDKGVKEWAKSTGDSEPRWMKFMGDFMQIVSAIHAQDALNSAPPRRYVPASGDGMFVVIYLYLARKLGVTPRIVTSTDANSYYQLVNLNEFINVKNINQSTRNMVSNNQRVAGKFVF